MSGMMSIDRRTRTLVGSVILLASVALLGSWLILGERGFGTASEGAEVLAQATEGDEDDADGVELASLTVTYDHFLARDPFESIRPPEPVSTDPDPVNGDTGNGTSDGNGIGEPGNDDDGVCRTGAEAVCDGTVVVLRAITDGVAAIEVDGVTYQVEPSGVFATNFQLIRVEGECADILYLEGDEADVFRLCVGGTVAK